MTRKDYVALAAALADAKPGSTKGYERLHGWCAAVNAVADVLGSGNPRFDRVRFLFASGFTIARDEGEIS